MKTVSNLSNNIYNWFSKDQAINCIKSLSENQILNLANSINGILNETKFTDSTSKLSLPKLVVVGTQSSGKSSVLNGLIGMDILPTGKNMITRTPLNINMYKLDNNKDGWIEFGCYNKEGYNTDIKIPIDVPKPTNEQVNQIREFIKEKTIQLAGNGMNISDKEIILKIHSPYVPNLSLIDLPGLTMLAQIDKGQPSNIKEKIEGLVTKYIKQRRTIILTIMQARPDLETDLGLHLVKKYDNTDQRTIGVLTKPDLMSTGEHIGKYLTNSISKNLMLTYGYYAIRGRSNKEIQEMDILKGFDMEKEYFSTHPEYSKSLYSDRIGMINLTFNLNKILVTAISEIIPSVMTEIISLESTVNKKLDSMGCDLPITKEGKISVLNRYVSNFNSRFMDSIESRGTILNIGKRIKEIFIQYRNNIRQCKPFRDTDKYNDEYYKNIISSFEGNHMSYSTPPVQVLEACMTDEKLKPIMILREPTIICVDDICDLLIYLLNDISKLDEFIQYRPLAKYISSIVIDSIISKLKMKTKDKIREIFTNEESYIWTDDQNFIKILQSTTSKEFNTDTITELLEGYFKCITEHIAHMAPKIIMNNIIRQIQRKLLAFLIQNIVNEDKIYLLKEDDEIEKQRTYYNDLRDRIHTIKKTFSNNIINNL
jgi:hypothetical protein